MRLYVLTLAVLTLLSGRQAKSVTIDYDTVIDYRIPEVLEVVDGADSTTVDIISGASIEAVRVYDTSTVNFYGGTNWGDTDCYDSSTVNVYGGEFDDDVVGEDFSTVNIFDGRIGEGLQAKGSSIVNLFGGSVEVIWAGGWSDLHDAILTVVGSGFNLPYGPIAEDSGTLTGTLANGDPINASFRIFSDASIVLAVPEPSSIALPVAAAIGLVACTWRRRPTWM